VNENTGNSRYEFFYELLDNPADLTHPKASNLQLLVNEFPQSGLLRAMQAVKPEEESLHSASTYVNPKLLYTIANAIGTLNVVTDEQIVVCQKPGEAQPLLPIPSGVELPNFAIDESNYFHVPIDLDLVYLEDEKAGDIELLEENPNSEDIDNETGGEEIQAPVVDPNIGVTENETEYNEEVVSSPEVGNDVTEESETEEDAERAPSSEVDTQVKEENETGENAEVASLSDAEVKEEIETEENAEVAPLSEADAEVQEDNEAEIAPSSEVDTEVKEENETKEEVAPSSETDAEVKEEDVTEENEELAPLLEIDAEAAPVAKGQTEETDQAVEQHGVEDQEDVEQDAEQAGEEANTSEETTQVNEVDADTSYEENKPQTDSLVVEAEAPGADSTPSHADQEIDDEVFEEIVSIEDIGLEQLAIMDKTTIADEPEENVANEVQQNGEEATGDSYFVFEPTLPEDEEYHAAASIATPDEESGKEQQKVSRYNDEKMPYSFMWWLDKTRKEHAAIYRPFAVEGKFHTETISAVEKAQPPADHLQQQYVENIFAVSAVVSDLNVIPPKADSPPVETKADKIIEKFIHEEPQIKHPSKVKLDSENKAKKSSEDRDELVTETLAKIYTEQMLYHKAILTYKKLMLKFPEKSLYFAGQIEQLENKIN